MLFTWKLKIIAIFIVRLRLLKTLQLVLMGKDIKHSNYAIGLDSIYA